MVANGRSICNQKMDRRLPVRLFMTDRFPSKRLNIYSKLDTLMLVRDILQGTEEFERIKASCFGRLFDLPLSRCHVSCKLINALLTRQLVSKKKYEIWSVFGGHPFWFSLSEFGAITGLPCDEFPEGYDPEDLLTSKAVDDEYWQNLIGLPKSATLADIAQNMRDNPGMPSCWRRLRRRLPLAHLVDKNPD